MPWVLAAQERSIKNCKKIQEFAYLLKHYIDYVKNVIEVENDKLLTKEKKYDVPTEHPRVIGS